MSIIDIFQNIDFFKFPLLVGILLCLSASVVGVVLVLKRYSMIGDGLSHVSFGVVAVAMAVNVTPKLSIFVAIPIVVIVAYFLLLIGNNTKMKGDSAIALISSSALAIAYLVLNVTGTSIDIDNYLFGSILFATKKDFFLILPIAVIVIVFFVLFYNRIFAVTFDEAFAKATGTNTKLYNAIFAILTAIIIVLGMRIMGTLLISSLIIFPALTSMQVFKKFKLVIISSAIISVVNFLVSFFAFTNFPSGASVVIVNLVTFIVFACLGQLMKIKVS